MKAYLIIFCLILLFSIPVFAQDKEELLFIDIPVITASKVSQPLKEAPSNIIVITREEIKKRGYQTIADALRNIESIYIVASERHLQKAYIRGMGTVSSYNDKILLLINGTPQREIVYGHAFIDEYLSLGNVERIEVIKGPGSAMYGTNALIGVINVITTQKFDGMRVTGGIGTQNTTNFNLLYGKEKNGQSLVIYASHYDTEGDGMVYSQKGQRNVRNDDPCKSQSFWLTYSVGDFLIEGKYIEFHHKFASQWDVPENIWDNNWFNYNNFFIDLQYEHHFSDEIEFYLKTWWQYYDDDSFWQKTDDGVVISDIWPEKKSQIAGIETHLRAILPHNHDFIVSSEFNYENIISVEDIEINRENGEEVTPSAFWIPSISRKVYSLSFQDQWKMHPKVLGTIGGRFDFHEVYGTQFNPRLAFMFFPNSKFSFNLFYGQAFRAPSYRELYTHTETWTEGNKNLEPEKIETTEFEIIYTPSQYLLGKVNFYHSKFYNFILREEIEDQKKYVNSDELYEFDGVELFVSTNFKKITTFANYGYNYSEDQSTGEELYSIPKNTANAGFTLSINELAKFSASLSFVGSRKRWGDDKNKYDPRYPLMEKRPDLKAYTTVNCSMETSRENWALTISVTNLFNETQYDAHESPKYMDMERPGRNFILKLTYKL